MWISSKWHVCFKLDFTTMMMMMMIFVSSVTVGSLTLAPAEGIQKSSLWFILELNCNVLKIP